MSQTLELSKWLNATEQDALARVLCLCRERDARNALMIELAWKCGARASELLAIEPGDLNDVYRTVRIRGLKGSDSRDVALNKDLYARLRAHANSAEQGGRLFPIAYRRLEQIWRDYRPVAKTFHSLRHTFAVELYQKTKDILKVKRALGHRSLANTMIYTTVVYDPRELMRDAL